MNFRTPSSLLLCLVLVISPFSFAQAEEEICSPEDTLIPHPIYCAFFYICNDGVAELMECPPGLYYNPERLTCDFDYNVPNCDGGTHPTSPQTTSLPPVSTTPNNPPTTTTTLRTTITPVTEPTVTTGNPTTPTPQTEPTVAPSNPTTTTIRTTEPGTPNLWCPEDIDSIFMPYPQDCTRYYFCSLGEVQEVRSCSGDLWFKFELQACMTPWQAECPNSK